MPAGVKGDGEGVDDAEGKEAEGVVSNGDSAIVVMIRREMGGWPCACCPRSGDDILAGGAVPVSVPAPADEDILRGTVTTVTTRG